MNKFFRINSIFLRSLVSLKTLIHDYKIMVLLMSLFGILIMLISPYYMRYLESRQGYLLYDPILELLPSVDVSIHIMVIMNLVTIPTIIFLLGRPYLLIKGLLAFNILLLLRYTVLYLVPLEAPIGYLPLTDPFLDTFIYRNGNISKDLFFSGHTAFMFLAYLLAPNQVLKISNFIGFLSIGILLMIQHVHYSYDVLAAPFFSLLAYYSSYYFFERYLVIKSKITS